MCGTDRHGASCPGAAARLAALLLLVGLGAGYAAATQAQPGGTAVDLDGLPEAAYAPLSVLNVRDADLRDVLRGLAHQYGLNLVVDNRIERRVTLRLSGLPVVEAVAFLCRDHGLVLTRNGAILQVGLPPPPPPALPAPLRLAVQDGRLTADLQGEDLADVARGLAEASGRNVVVRQGVHGPVRGLLRDVPFETGLRTLLQSNGFSVREQDGLYLVDRAGPTPAAGGDARAFWVQATDSTVALDVAGVPIADVLREVGAQLGANVVTYQAPEGVISARVKGLTLEATLAFLLKGTSVTYRREGDVYVVGHKQTSGIAATRLLRLDHLRADAVLALVPEALRAAATIQAVREHNGLMVTGTNDVLAELEAFVRTLDYPTPQILIEALVVDFETKDLFELGARFGWHPGGAPDAAAADGEGGYGFETGSGARRGLRHGGRGRDARPYLEPVNALTGLFGLRRLGQLPDDFYFQVHALSQEGRANVRSRPQIATLNGHTASLSIGTTQYFILKSNIPYQQPGQFYLQQTERFERIEANVRLEVTPWVSASGEVTVEIRPEFSTPVGDFDPLVPPTINSRVLESTVRLRDGETIILGGLIQDVQAVVYDKVPFLGSLPLLGRLFRGRSKTTKKAELVIFLTPHVFYGDARDAAKWGALQERLDLSSGAGKGLGYTRLKP